jgi:hypothetical protein
MSGSHEDDLVPVSVRLGEVVPPEDPEDWTKPLTWVAAVGMLMGPLVALAWFVVAPPSGTDLTVGTWLLAAALAAGAVLTGSTQLGALRAWTATVAAALFAALVVVLLGVVLAGERQVGAASPTLAHGFGAAVAGLVGSLAASPLAAALAQVGDRRRRLLLPGAVGSGVAILVIRLLNGAA